MDELKMREREVKSEQKKLEGFDKWLGRAETKMVLSLIPSAETPEALTTLLKSAFEAGHNCGSGDVLSTMVEAMLMSKDKRDDRDRDRF